jgi:glycosyltransferase involved in cell wall biosynthesis
MPTVVLAMPGVLSTLVARVDGTRQLLGYPINALCAVTRRTTGRYDVVMVPRPGSVRAENRPPPPPGAPLPAWSTLYELVAGTIRLAILASHEKATIYHAHDLDTLPAAAFAAWRRKATLIYDTHEDWPGMNPNPLRRAMWSGLERLFVRRADIIMTINDSLARCLTERTGKPCIVVPNYPQHEDHGTQTAASNRHSWSVPEGAIVVRYHGLYLEDRGLEEIIRAVPLLAPATIITFQGYGPLEDSLRALARGLHVEDRVRFLPPLPGAKIAGAALGADIGIHCIRGRTLNDHLCSPNKVYEYLHAGLALVVSDLPEMRAIVDATGAGVVCNPNDPASIAAAITTFTSNRSRLSAAQEAARAAAPRFSWQHESDRLRELYRDLATKDPSRV